MAAALVLGLVWVGWHLPQFFTREWDTPRSTLGDVAAFVVLGLAAGVVLAWVVNAARGSVLLAILGHGAINGTPGVVAAAAGRGYETWPVSAGLVVLALGIIVTTRGRLGVTPTLGSTSTAAHAARVSSATRSSAER